MNKLNKKRITHILKYVTLFTHFYSQKQKTPLSPTRGFCNYKSKYQLPQATHDSGSSSEQAICAKASSFVTPIKILFAAVVTLSCACFM